MSLTSTSNSDRIVYTVSELSEILRSLLEDSLPTIWVQGEISNFSRPSSGHWYFSLKDKHAQLRCVMFRRNNFSIFSQPSNGDEVLLRGRISLYPARGDLQLICEYLEPAGSGALLRAYEEMKKKLASEGLFDAAFKRPMPSMPHSIGLITSGSGAAVHDVITTLERRWPLAWVTLYPVSVQGASAAPEIVKALDCLPQRAAVDLILLVRGGGSLEDLWAFNEEAVARAIRACSVPVVTGVGHETDITIADFAADLRAPTPTAAAELATPDMHFWLNQVGSRKERLAKCLQKCLERARNELNNTERRLQNTHPDRRLRDGAQRLDDLELRLRHATHRQVRANNSRLDSAFGRLRAMHPSQRLKLNDRRLAQTVQLLRLSISRQVDTERQRLNVFAAVLDSLSPLAVLGRGYAVATDTSGNVIHDIAQIQLGSCLTVRLARGTAETEVRRLIQAATPEN